MCYSVLICGEGPTDSGKRDYDNGIWIDGPAIAFFRKASGGESSVEGIEHSELKKAQKIQKTKSKGHGVKAERLAIYAARNNYDTARCYVDSDTTDEKEYNRIYRSVKDGIQNSNAPVQCIPMIPKSMIESWLLGDPEAYRTVFSSTPEDPPLPKKPEKVWGQKRDPESNYPKNVLARVLSQYDPPDPEWGYEIAFHSNPDTMKLRCNLSYSRFYADVQEMLVKLDLYL